MSKEMKKKLHELRKITHEFNKNTIATCNEINKYRYHVKAISLVSFIISFIILRILVVKANTILVVAGVKTTMGIGAAVAGASAVSIGVASAITIAAFNTITLRKDDPIIIPTQTTITETKPLNIVTPRKERTFVPHKGVVKLITGVEIYGVVVHMNADEVTIINGQTNQRETYKQNLVFKVQ